MEKRLCINNVDCEKAVGGSVTITKHKYSNPVETSLELIGVTMNNMDVTQLLTLLTLICCTAYWDYVDQLHIDKPATQLITCSNYDTTRFISIR